MSELREIWRPWPGFQERALAANADEVFKGGAKGPGKTDLLIVAMLRWVHRAAFAGLFLRLTYKALARPLDRATAIYGALPADQRPAWNGDLQRFTFPTRAFVQFGHCRVVEDVANYMGGNWGRIAYDELGDQPNESVADRLISELRCPDQTIRRQFDGSGNPGFAGHGWTKKRYVTPTRRGQQIAFTMLKLPDGTTMPWSRQFVPGRVTDNPIYANDRTYMAQLMLLPDRMRKCLLEGDYDAASGMALDEVEPAAHLVPPFECPAHWPYVSAMDWGFDHWFMFMWGRVSDDGRIYVCETIKRRLMRDPDLAGTLNERVPAQALMNVHAGHDCWHQHKAYGDNTPTTAAYFGTCGIQLTRANIARVSGYRNMLRYMSWRESEYLPQRVPMVQFFDTPTNRWLLEEHLTTLVCDPDDVTDVLKQDANSETGLGGDDGYDCLRYLLAARPLKAESGAHLLNLSAWDPLVLAREAEKLRTPDLEKPDPRAARKGLYFGV